MTETTTVPSTGSNGAAAAGAIEVENPATGRTIASVAEGGVEDVDRAVEGFRVAGVGEVEQPLTR